MSESVKPRFAVDLDEIEKQLAYGQGSPAQQGAPNRSDPLAELARIVGQDDPFQAMLSPGAAPQRNQVPNLDELFAAQERVAPVHGFQEPELRANVGAPPAFDLDQYQQVATAGRAYAVQPDNAAGPAYDQADYDQQYYAAAGQDPVYADAPEQDERPLKRHGFRRGKIAIGAVACAVVLGTGFAWYANGSNSIMAGGKPPLIKASKEPTKVQPENPGGVEIPNQNKQIYDRSAQQPGETKVVNREEQPVDVKQATRVASADATASVPNGPGNMLNLGEPRKVRTVSIRPGAPGVEAKPAAAPPVVTMPPAAQAAPVTQPAPAKAVAATPAIAQVPVATAAPKPATPAPATPTATPQPQKVASAVPTAPAAVETPAGAGGGFSVQLGVRSSEGDAQAAYRQFQQKYGELGGVPAMIRKAESNGNVIYRVRTAGMSRDEASSLCSKLQGQGGQCFVAKN